MSLAEPLAPRLLLGFDYFIRYEIGSRRVYGPTGWKPILNGRDHDHASVAKRARCVDISSND